MAADETEMSEKGSKGAARPTATAQGAFTGGLLPRVDTPESAAKSPEPEPPGVANETKAKSSEKETHTEGGTQDFVVRDTFSMPHQDHAVIETLRNRAAREGRISNKSEVVRAALRLLETLPAAGLVAHLGSLERVKPGRKRHASHGHAVHR